MTRDEFVKKIRNGSDIEFTVNGVGYTICTWTDEGISIGEWNKAESVKNYSSPEELVDDFPVKTKKLGEVTDAIIIINYTSNGSEINELSQDTEVAV